MITEAIALEDLYQGAVITIHRKDGVIEAEKHRFNPPVTITQWLQMMINFDDHFDGIALSRTQKGGCVKILLSEKGRK